MIICSNCGKQLPEGTAICTECGYAVDEPQAHSDSAGTKESAASSVKTDDHSASAVVSGENGREEVVQPEASEAMKHTDTAKEAETKSVGSANNNKSEQSKKTSQAASSSVDKNTTRRFSKKSVAVICSCVAVILVAAIALALIFIGGDKVDSVLYIDGQNLFYSSVSDAKPVQITQNLASNDKNFSGVPLSPYCFDMAYSIQLSESGDKLFYPDELSDGQMTYTLCCLDVNNPDSEPVKIDTEVDTYKINHAGDKVLYTKNFALYSFDFNESTKIADNVIEYAASNDFDEIYYTDLLRDLYHFDIGDEAPELIDRKSQIAYTEPDFSFIYYLKEGVLHKLTSGGENTELATDIYSAISFYPGGEAFYVKSTSTLLSEYVEDDMLQADEAITQEPMAPLEPSAEDFGSDAEYQAAMEEFNTEFEAYMQRLAVYEAKKARDDIRDLMASEDNSIKDYSLYYFDGSKETLLSDLYVSTEFMTGANISDVGPMYEFVAYSEKPEIEKFKLSGYDDFYALQGDIRDALTAEYVSYLAYKGDVVRLGENVGIFRINDDGDTAYYLLNDGERGGDLYRITVSGGKLGQPELYDTDVSDIFYVSADGKTVSYCKNLTDAVGDLYVNKEPADTGVSLIDANVVMYSMNYGGYIEDSDTLVYMVDVVDGVGTLKAYRDGKTEIIAENVKDYYVTDYGQLIYICGQIDNPGALYVYDGSKSALISEDAMAIVPIFSASR